MAGRENTHQKAAQGRQLVRLVSSGVTLYDASKKIGVDYKTAGELFRKQLAEVADNTTRREALQIELHTLQLAQQGLMPHVLRGEHQAVNSLMRVMERRARYLGLDEAIKVEIQTTKINDAVSEIAHIIEGDVDTDSVQELRRVLPESA